MAHPPRPGLPGDPTGPGTPPDLPRLLVVHPGAELYGSDRVVLESVAALVTAFDVTVALPDHGPLVQELRARGARVVRCRMPVLRRAALQPRGALTLVTDALLGLLPALVLLRRYGPAGVYVNTVTLPSWIALARLAGRRSVCHVHEAERDASLLQRRVMALCPAMADRVLANSRYSADVLAEVAPRTRRRCTVLYNAVQGPDAPVPARLELTGPLRLLFVGRLSPRKGPQVALATLRELVERGVDARLSMLGSVFRGYEWFEADLHRLASGWGLTERVEFLGFRPDVFPHLADADVVLVPSVAEESFGNIVVEAVLAARPVVVSDFGGLREAAAGYRSVQRVQLDRPLDWADAVQRVAADWAGYRTGALADAEDARRRHAPAAYVGQLVEEMRRCSDHQRGGEAPGTTRRTAPAVQPGGGPPPEWCRPAILATPAGITAETGD